MPTRCILLFYIFMTLTLLVEVAVSGKKDDGKVKSAQHNVTKLSKKEDNDAQDVTADHRGVRQSTEALAVAEGRVKDSSSDEEEQHMKFGKRRKRTHKKSSDQTASKVEEIQMATKDNSEEKATNQGEIHYYDCCA